jgi:hypothetical protein
MSVETIKEYLAKEYRTVSVADVSVLVEHPAAREMTIGTLIVDPIAAEAEAVRQLELRKTGPAMWNITIPTRMLPSDVISKTINVDINRYGCSGGKLFTVLKCVNDYQLETTILQVWG